MESINFKENELNKGLRTLVNSVYNSKGRFYHGVNHINSMLQRFEELYEKIPEVKDEIDYESMRLAIIFHDLIQGCKDAEFTCADIVSDLLTPLETPVNFMDIRNVGVLIRYTDYVFYDEGIDPDECLIRDLDLEGLGAPWEVYLHNSFLIRQEYPNISMDEFCKGRKKFIKHILSFEKIYSTPYFEHLEEQARANLKRELEFCEL